MRKRFLLLALLLLVAPWLHARVVRFGQYEVQPEQNVRPSAGWTRGGGDTRSSLQLGFPINGKVNVLVQFKKTPTMRDYARLEAAGIVLSDYVGGNAYFALVPPGKRPSDFHAFGATSVIPLQPEWKMATPLVMGEIPEWAQRGVGMVEVTLHWFANVDEAYARSFAVGRGYAVGSSSEALRALTLTLPAAEVKVLAAEPWVQHVALVDPPYELQNYGGQVLGAATVAMQSVELGGRGLTGKGVSVGLWDGNIERHVDYGDRAHVLEFETSVAESGGHGMHTAGTIIGAGVLDPRARGVAPKAELYASNFNTGRNGLSEAKEMLAVSKEHNIALTSNSYGVNLGRLCKFYNMLTYSIISTPMLIDQLSNRVPTLTHFYSAGNSQGDCGKEYGSNFARAKNVVYVGAVNGTGVMSDFSSFGPMDDGRLTPTVSSKGVDVFSTVGDNGYTTMSGTSMACPMTSGMATLLTERYHQLHGGANANSALLKGLMANTADDRGNAGPDYKYGFGIVNLESALTALENGWYREGVVMNGTSSFGHKIQVPAGVKQLRVMLTWIDPVVVKNYAYGEPALINDLDLAVEVGGETVLPWILDAKNPANDAVRGVDTLNNIEQVTVDKPAAGEVTVKIGGHSKIREGQEQKYVLTWYFDYGKPVLLHPVGGEVFSTEETLMIRANNLSEKVRVELSYDDGKTYEYIGAAKRLFARGMRIPEDAEMTTKARVRVTDSEGNVLVSPRPFTIAPAPEELKYEAEACNVGSWKLTWKAVEGAERYVVLKADVPSGDWTKIGEVSAPEYSIPVEAISVGGRNVFAVAVKLDGEKFGPRSKGVLVAEPTAMSLADAGVPFMETFIDIPMAHAKLLAGKNMKTQWQETPAELEFPLGSHMLQAMASKDAAGEIFVDEANLFTLRHCELDFTKVTAGRKLLFYCYNQMSSSGKAEDSQFRLQVDGATVKNAQGEESYKASGALTEMVWDISGCVGKKVRIDMQFAAIGSSGSAVVIGYGVREASEDPDVGALLREKVQRKAQMGVENLQIEVYSESLAEIKEVPLVVKRDGKLVATRLIKDLKPFEMRKVQVPVDFSTEEPLGQVYKVQIEVSAEGDTYLQNNTTTTEVYNMGKVFALPKPNPRFFFGMKLLDDPRITKIVDEPLLFTDDGGVLQDYGPDHISSVKFMPADPSKVIYIAFRKCEMKGRDAMAIYADGLAKDFEYDKETATYEYTEKGGSEFKSFVSGAKDGSITTFFNDRNYDEGGAGWVAEVRQVPRANSLTLLPLDVADNYPTESTQLKIKVKNLTPQEMKDVDGVLVTKFPLTSVSVEPINFVIPSIPAKGEVEYTIQDTIKLPYPTKVDVKVFIRGLDADASDNTQSASIWNDRFWKGGEIKDIKKQGINGVSVVPTDLELKLYGARQDYALNKVLPFYTKTVNPLIVELKNEPEEEDLPASIHVWIDFDDKDAGFADVAPEHYKVALEEGETNYDLPVDLTAANVKAGKYRMRVAVLPDASTETFIKGGEAAWGRSTDIIAEVIEGANPKENDVEVRFRGTDLQSGQALSATQKVSGWVINNGHHPIKDVEVQLFVDGTLVGTHTVPNKIPAFYENEVLFEFPQTIDLSRPKKYTLELKLTKEDGDSTNNVAKREVISTLPLAKDKFYTLAFEGDEKEKIAVPLLIGESDSATMEGWFKLDEPQFSTLFKAKGLWVASTYRMRGDIPDNAIAIVAGRKMLRYTKANTFMPGSFHHVAVAIKVKLGIFFSETLVKLYIDGKEVELEGDGDDVADFYGLSIGNELKGEVKMFRFWIKRLKENEVAENMGKSVRGADGSLPAECVAEYMMNEGAQSYISSEGQWIAEIVSDRVDAAENNIWKERSQLVDAVRFEGQLLPSELASDGAITFVMPHDFSDYANVTGEIVALWPNTKVLYKGAEVQPDTKFDFSGADHEISIDASNTVFGFALEQKRLKIRLVSDKNPEAEIKKLDVLVADNANLKEDVRLLSDLSQTVVLAPEDKSAAEPLDVSKLVVTFTELSAGAKLEYNDKTIAQGEKLELDLTRPVSVKVIAENEREFSFYTLQVSKGQTITWESSSLELAYTNEVRDMKASSSSGLPVVYRSLDPNVATIDAKGNLHTAGVGETEVVATVPADGVYAAAEAVTRKVKVTPATLTISPEPMAMDEGDAIPEVALRYAGLLFNEAKVTFKQPRYEIYKDAATVWTPDMAPLAPGSYAVKAQGYTAPYQDGNYMVTLEAGILEVKASTVSKLVSFVVRDGANAAVAGATVTVNGVELTTTAEGKASIKLMPGVYQYEVVKDDHQAVAGEVKVEKADVEQPVSLLKLEVTLTYTVSTSGHGTIFGEKVQRLPKGGTGSPVTAVPEDGYLFDGWDDGSKEVARTDSGITEDKGYVASFKAVEFSLEYSVGDGGSWVSGNQSQTVHSGGNGTEVEVQANPGYVFLGWSDGVRTLTRTDKDVHGDIRVTAQFYKLFTLPIAENFDFYNGLPRAWSVENLSTAKGATVWTFGTHKRTFAASRERGNYMYVDSDITPRGILDSTGLRTPWFDISVVTDDIVVGYDLFFKEYGSGKLKLQYSFDGENWTDVVLYSNTLDPSGKQEYTIEAAALAGQQKMQLRWLYGAEYDGWVAVDNVVIEVKNKPVLVEYYASANGKLKTASDPTLKEKVEVTTPRGTDGEAVTAVADAGYQFDRWSDGKTEEERKDSDFGRYVATFKRVPKTKYDVTYLADDKGRIEGFSYQQVEEGEKSLEVKAVALNGKDQFVKWSDGRKDNPRVDENVMGALTVTAEFASRFRLTTSVKGRGELVAMVDGKPVAEDGFVASGATVEFTATPGDSYEIASWEGVQATPANAATAQLVMDEDKEVSVTFAPKKATLTFLVVKRGTADPIAGASVTLEGKASQQTNAEGKVEFAGLTYRRYEYSVSLPGGTSVAESVEVQGDMTKRVEMDWEGAVATFIVSLNATPQEGAVVEIDGRQIATDANGKAIFSLSRKVYDYTVMKRGFKEAKGKVDLSGGDKEEAVKLESEARAIFIVRVNGVPVADATVSIGGTTAQTDAEGKVTVEGLEKREYDYEVTKTGFQKAEGKVDLKDGEKEVEVSLVSIAEVTFTVQADGKAVEGASVELGGVTVQTDASGAVTIYGLQKESYDYTVVKDGYKSVAGKVDLSGGNQTVSVTLEKDLANVTFTVLADGKAVAGASVALNGRTLQTNADGKAVFEGLEKRAYDYAVTKAGYKNASGKVDLAGGNQTVSVQLVKQGSPTPVEAVALRQVTLRPNPATTVLYLDNTSDVERLWIASVGGVELLRRENPQGEQALQVSLEGFAEGTYVLVVESRGERRALPFVVRK